MPLLLLAVAFLASGLSFGLVRLFGVFVLRLDASPAFYVLSALVIFPDALDLVLRLWLRRVAMRDRESDESIPPFIGQFTPRQVDLHLRPWAFVASVHNLEPDMEDFLEGIGPYRDRLYVVDDASTDETFQRLVRAGIHCLRLAENRKKPAALRELLATLPAEIETVVVLDPDVRFPRPEAVGGTLDLTRAVFELQRSGLAALCPRFVVRADGLLSDLQAFEYRLNALGRHTLLDRCITSGVSLYRRDALECALARHSLSVYGEDLQIALLLLAENERIYFDGRLVAETTAKRTWRGWFSQRVGWSFALIRVYHERFREVRRCASGGALYAYQFLFYLGGLALLLQPLRVASFLLLTASFLNGLDGLLGLSLIPDTPLTNPAYFVAAAFGYTALALLILVFGIPAREWKRHLAALPLYFLYVIVHVVPVTLGYLNWFSLRLFGKRVYDDHYQDAAALLREMRAASQANDATAR